MIIRRVLIFVPLLVILILLQSYFWVPTYEEQTRGNPNPLRITSPVPLVMPAY